jgi:hypothetical protein
MRTPVTLVLSTLILLAALPVHCDDLQQLPSVNSVAVQEQNISTTCYLGNPNDKNSLGDCVVHSAAEAGTVCNSLFYACKGACFGCFSDFDLSQDVCVDARGRKFLW